MEQMIYLDNAATTFPKPECVYTALDNANRNLAVNSGRGSYRLARETTKIIDDTKNMIKKLTHAPQDASVVFLPSITIAMNIILNGIHFSQGSNVYVSPYEHNAVARTLHLIEKIKGINIIELPFQEDSLEIDLEKMKYMFTRNIPTCVCCTHISNVTGYVLPIREIFEFAKQYNSITVLDTAQSMGVLDMNISELNTDFVAFTGHKSLYGPFGIGGFIDMGKVELNNYIVGGTGSDSLNLEMPDQIPAKYESSSPNIVTIAGLNAALIEYNPTEVFNKEKTLTEYLVSKLSENENVILYLPAEDRHIGVISFNVNGYKAEDAGMILDEDYNIAVRTGYHCAPFVHKYLNDFEYTGTIRVGLGKFNTKDDIDALINAIQEL